MQRAAPELSEPLPPAQLLLATRHAAVTIGSLAIAGSSSRPIAGLGAAGACQPLARAGADCPIIRARRDWAAWVNAMPGTERRPDADRHRQGHRADRRLPDRLSRDMRVDAKAIRCRSFADPRARSRRAGPATQAVDRPTTSAGNGRSTPPVGSVTVRCGSARRSPRISACGNRALAAKASRHAEPRLADHRRRRAASSPVIAFLPLLGWANWLIIPLALIGAGVGMMLEPQRRAQPQPVRHRHRHLPADARRRHPVKDRHCLMRRGIADGGRAASATS